jgi:hypothetical protein
VRGRHVAAAVVIATLVGLLSACTSDNGGAIETGTTTSAAPVTTAP